VYVGKKKKMRWPIGGNFELPTWFITSCFKSSGRFCRHTEINSIINRSLTSIHVNSTLEPNGLSMDYGKRPAGMTLVPWIKGQPLVWDVTVTVVDTLADSYVLKTSEVSGFAAEMACKRKHSKYRVIHAARSLETF
jgi:hypothetical protein